MNFKVKCTDLRGCNAGLYKVDEIYSFENGVMTDSTGKRKTIPLFQSFEDFTKWTASKFELVEEESKVGDFKVRCVKAVTKNAIEHTVYEVKDGILHLENGSKYKHIGSPFNKFENVTQINEQLRSKFELVTEPKPFTKADLRTGMRVETRKGDIYAVFLDTEVGDIIQGKWWNLLNQYENDLTINYDPRLDIVKVYSKDMNSNLTNITQLGKLLWQRTEPTYITIAEAEAALTEAEGKKVEITDNEGNPLKK